MSYSGFIKMLYYVFYQGILSNSRKCHSKCDGGHHVLYLGSLLHKFSAARIDSTALNLLPSFRPWPNI